MSIWIAAARPKTLPAAIVPVVVGTACAHAVGGIAWGPALAALAGALAIQIGTNFANDVFDAEKGTDGPDRIGPLRAVATGAITAATMKRAMIAAFAIATAFGAYLAWVAGWPVVAIGVASVLSGIAYTGGPWPLGYHGLGDVFVMVFFGLVAVCGTVFVQLGHVPMLAVWVSLLSSARSRPRSSSSTTCAIASATPGPESGHSRVRFGRARGDRRVRAAARDRVRGACWLGRRDARCVAAAADRDRAARVVAPAPPDRDRRPRSSTRCSPRPRSLMLSPTALMFAVGLVVGR